MDRICAQCPHSTRRPGSAIASWWETDILAALGLLCIGVRRRPVTKAPRRSRRTGRPRCSWRPLRACWLLAWVAKIISHVAPDQSGDLRSRERVWLAATAENTVAYALESRFDDPQRIFDIPLPPAANEDIAIAITLIVNGERRMVPAEPDTPLLYVLRNDCGLNGAKFGCGLAQCGACTVLVGGLAVRSCVTEIGAIGASEI